VTAVTLDQPAVIFGRAGQHSGWARPESSFSFDLLAGAGVEPGQSGGEIPTFAPSRRALAVRANPLADVLRREVARTHEALAFLWYAWPIRLWLAGIGFTRRHA